MVRKKIKVNSKNMRRAVSSVMPRIKLSKYAFANSLGLVSGLIILIYAIMSWLSDFDTLAIASLFPLPFSFNSITLIIGVIQAYVLAYIFGWIFVKIYNKTI
ncbi:hypothetical protein COU60_03640 [Candidatus Pacearchaeota archaeon CG10_big_fil_rev_8_21_14_0_10_34_76]|nr:MAG: hypothetical protein COU60_03640 [Candidatus Pacearchaeota archaeon CG10_big_fil_rev_8_21_14_0_10_34_76]